MRKFLLALLLAALSFNGADAQVAGQYSITFGGTASGPNYTGVIGDFSDPSVRGFADTDVQVGDFVAEKRNDGTIWTWRITTINSTGPLNIDVEPAGDHTLRPAANLQTGDGAITEMRDTDLCWIPPFTFHGINSNLFSAFHNLNDPHPAGVGDTNLAITDLTADATHTHDFAGFNQAWTSLGAFTLNGDTNVKLEADNVGGDISTVQVTPTTSKLDTVLAAGDFAGLYLTGGSFRLEAEDGASNNAYVKSITATAGASAGEPQLAFKTAAVHDGTATAGEFVSLIDAATGEAEFATAVGTINYNTVMMPKKAILNFTGDGVVVSENGNTLDITIEDLNLLNDNLTQDDNRIHDFASFTQTWNNVGGITSNATGAHNFSTVFTGETANLSTNQSGKAQASSTDGTLLSRSFAEPGKSAIDFADGIGNLASYSVEAGAGGEPQLFAYTQAIDAGTATNGQVATLVDNTTGEWEWATGGGADTHFLNANLSSAASQSWLHNFNNSEMGWDEVKNFYVNLDNDALTGPNMYFGMDPTGSIYMFYEDSTLAGLSNQLIIDNSVTTIKSEGPTAGGGKDGSFDIATGGSIGMYWSTTAAGATPAAFKITDSDTASGRPQLHLRTDGIIQGTASNGQYLKLVNSVDGEVEWDTVSGAGIENVVEDTTPQLGGALDVNAFKITSTSNGNVDIEPNGTGNVLLGNYTFNADQTVGAGQDNYVMTYDDGTGLVSLEAAGSGTDSDAIHDNVTGEIAAITEKTTPVSGDFLLIEDSEASNAKKRLQIGNLPSTGGGGGGVARKGCRALHAGSTGVNVTSPTVLALNSEDFDEGGWHDNVTNNSRLTVPSDAGDKVDVCAFIRVTNLNADAYVFIQLYKDGSAYKRLLLESGSTQAQGPLTLLGEVVVPGTTYFELGVIVETDTSVDIEATTTSLTVMETVQTIGSTASDRIEAQNATADSNVTGTTGIKDICDPNGFSADRTYTLPAAASLDARCGVAVKSGSASFELLIKTGAVGSLIDGVDYSTNEWSRLFIAGENVTFLCVDGSGPKWIVEEDRRKPCVVEAYLSTNADGETASTWTVPTSAATPGAWTETDDNGGCFTTTTSTFSSRRSGRYQLLFMGQVKDALADAGSAGIRFYDGTNERGRAQSLASASSSAVVNSLSRNITLAAGDTIITQYQSSAGGIGLGEDASSNEATTFSVVEHLR